MPASGTRFAFCYGLVREFHIASEATLRNKGECITWNHYEPRAYFMGYILYMYTCIPRMCPANERRRYSVTPSLIGWLHTQIEPLHFSLSECRGSITLMTKSKWEIILYIS